MKFIIVILLLISCHHLSQQKVLFYYYFDPDHSVISVEESLEKSLFYARTHILRHFRTNNFYEITIPANNLYQLLFGNNYRAFESQAVPQTSTNFLLNDHRSDKCGSTRAKCAKNEDCCSLECIKSFPYSYGVCGRDE